MRIVVTGASGFIGKNLCVMLAENNYKNVIKIGRNTSKKELARILKGADFVYHLAGVNRSTVDNEFKIGNIDLTNFIVDCLSRTRRNIPLMISSSTQAGNKNLYGKSKLETEKAVTQYSQSTGSNGYIYRLPNVFGKWCKPNYNSFVATFCNNVMNELPIDIHDSKAQVTLVYIDDVCQSLIELLKGKAANGFHSVTPKYETTVGEVASLLYAFKNSRDNMVTEAVGLGLTRALYSTYLSYMRPEQFSYFIPSYSDERGVFSEMLKTKDSGQFSFFTALPSVTRGGHYHHSKNEKFLVLKGKSRFRFQHIVTGERYELFTDSENFQIVETVPGWSHDITNIGDEEMVVMLWANEVFNRDNPDTFLCPL